MVYSDVAPLVENLSPDGQRESLLREKLLAQSQVANNVRPRSFFSLTRKEHLASCFTPRDAQAPVFSATDQASFAGALSAVSFHLRGRPYLESMHTR